jgi:hypothetical protein
MWTTRERGSRKRLQRRRGNSGSKTLETSDAILDLSPLAKEGVNQTRTPRPPAQDWHRTQPAHRRGSRYSSGRNCTLQTWQGTADVAIVSSGAKPALFGMYTRGVFQGRGRRGKLALSCIILQSSWALRRPKAGRKAPPTYGPGSVLFSVGEKRYRLRIHAVFVLRASSDSTQTAARQRRILF